MSKERTRAVVIGGGLAGLSAAVELRTRGLDVTIIDRNHHLGGKMNILEESGFTFDMGPTILTMPQVIRGIIERTGRTVSDYVDIVDLDPQWRCMYEDGTVIDLRGDVDGPPSEPRCASYPYPSRALPDRTSSAFAKTARPMYP